nr:MAG: hypothetical protein [Microvirus sp.]
MKFSKKFKKLYDDVVDTFLCRTISHTDIFHDEFLLLCDIIRAFSDYRFPLSKKQFNTYSNLRVSYSLHHKQDIYFVSFYSSISDFYFIVLVYKNHITFNRLHRSFMIKNNSSLNFDTLFSSVSQNNDLCLCSDAEQFLINIRALDIKK